MAYLVASCWLSGGKLDFTHTKHVLYQWARKGASFKEIKCKIQQDLSRKKEEDPANHQYQVWKPGLCYHNTDIKGFKDYRKQIFSGKLKYFDEADISLKEKTLQNLQRTDGIYCPLSLS